LTPQFESVDLLVCLPIDFVLTDERHVAEKRLLGEGGVPEPFCGIRKVTKCDGIRRRAPGGLDEGSFCEARLL
jgi:hypothetical protein